MADANLLKILYSEKKLENMVIYGNIRCAIKKPEFLSSGVSLTDGFFALVDVLALKCNGVDYFCEDGNNDRNHTYFSKGSIVIAINDKSLIGKNVRVYGKTTRGCTIKKQSTRSTRDGIVAFAWSRVGNTWAISPNMVVEFFDSDVKGTVLEDYIVSLISGVPFTYPDSVNAIMEYKGVSQVNPLEVENITGSIEYSTNSINLSDIDMKLVYRLDTVEESSFVGVVGEAVEDLSKKAEEYAKEVLNQIKADIQVEGDKYNQGKIDCYTDEVASKIINSFITNIANKYNFPISTDTKLKGGDYVDSLLDSAQTERLRGLEDDLVSNSTIFKEVDKIRKTVALSASVLRSDIVPILRNDLAFAASIIGVTTGVGVESIINNYNSCNRYNMLNISDWFWCLIRNPYLCGFLGSGMNIMDCDRVFYAYSEGYDIAECIKYRDMILTLNNIKSASSRSTRIPKEDLIMMADEYPSNLGKRFIGESGLPFSRECTIAVNVMTGDGLVDKELLKTTVDTRGILDMLNSVGLIEEVNGSIMLSKDILKEFLIYKELHKKSLKETGITDKQVDRIINKFEEDKGFKLEQLQKDGIHLVKYSAAVLCGCAGSGKTTTSDCMVDCFKEYHKDYNIKFGAPSGKAARRLSEVVGGTVSTIHSMFGVGVLSEPLLTSIVKTDYSNRNDEGGKYVYFLDEMAMANTNLMFEIVKHLNEDDIVFFLGDIKQLSPIGKGSPFRAMMKFLPCVELGVSKRAAEGSMINYNTGLINFVSDDYIVELKSSDDFEIISCPDVDIQRVTVDAFSRMLQKYPEDDIQVVSGYQSDAYPWGTSNINPMLQDLIRQETDTLFFYNNHRFMKGDRVIHKNRNSYDMPRFRMKSATTFEEVPTFGVVNGELGKIIGCVCSESCAIFPWENNDEDDLPDGFENISSKELKKIIHRRKNTNKAIRNDIDYVDEKMYFVIVQIYDVDLKEDVVVFYHANYREEISNDFYTKTFTGGDLGYLDLAYALTTHKMQGSQNPCIIIPIGSRGSSSFINRNMINTMITRASDKVILIGSVKGRNSALTNGRRVTSTDSGDDLLNLLV